MKLELSAKELELINRGLISQLGVLKTGIFLDENMRNINAPRIEEVSQLRNKICKAKSDLKSLSEMEALYRRTSKYSSSHNLEIAIREERKRLNLE